MQIVSVLVVTNQSGVTPSASIILVTSACLPVCLPACCCWSSQDPHPHTSRSAFLPAGGWHQALGSRVSDSTNTLPTAQLQPEGRQLWAHAVSRLPRIHSSTQHSTVQTIDTQKTQHAPIQTNGLLRVSSNKIHSSHSSPRLWKNSEKTPCFNHQACSILRRNGVKKKRAVEIRSLWCLKVALTLQPPLAQHTD